MDFSVIERFKLNEAFPDNQKFQGVTSQQDYLNELFEYSNRGTVFIHDDADVGHSVFVNDTKGLGSDKTFRIDNSHHKDLFLLHIDGILYSKGSKCDCAFLTQELMSFVEFKSNAVNNTEEAIEDNYDKARRQLTITYQDMDARCRKVGVDLRTATKLEAYAVFNRTVPKNNAHQKAQSARFLMDNKFKLSFENSTNI